MLNMAGSQPYVKVQPVAEPSAWTAMIAINCHKNNNQIPDKIQILVQAMVPACAHRLQILPVLQQKGTSTGGWNTVTSQPGNRQAFENRRGTGGFQFKKLYKQVSSTRNFMVLVPWSALHRHLHAQLRIRLYFHVAGQRRALH